MQMHLMLMPMQAQCHVNIQYIQTLTVTNYVHTNLSLITNKAPLSFFE